MTLSGRLNRIVVTGFSFMVATAALFPAPAHAQPVWQVVPGGVSLDAGAATTGAFDGPCTVAPPAMVGLVSPFFGHDMGQTNTASCRELTSCVLTATGDVNILIDGVGTPVLRIHWDGMSQVHHSCHTLRAYTGSALANLTATLGLTPVGVPNGTPVTVNYIWSQGSTNNYHPESPAPDDGPCRVVGTSLGVNATALFPDGFFDLINVRRGLFRNNEIGAFPATAGVQFMMNTDFGTDVYFQDPGNPPPPGTVPQDDDELTSYLGELTLSLVGPPPQTPANGEIDFSVDMGSDTCMAPALPADGNEVFDPGDMYPMGGPALPAGGQDGVLDDAAMFGGVDPRPAVPGPPIADVCSGMPVPPTETTNFDTDGSDSLDAATITAIHNAIVGGGPFPIPMLPSDCVRRAEFLLLSFDDDTASHVYDNGTCSAPAAAQSTTGRTYGSSGGGDEIVGAILIPFGGMQLAATYPAGREDDVHTSLKPNPPTNATLTQQAADDDVDALDERVSAACPGWLFSVDHEADFGLDPAVVYQSTPAGPVAILTEANIGLLAGTDLRDFEFGITPDATGQGVLTFLFTVAPDDPLTPANESGGLDPSMIYASYLNGTYFQFLAQPVPDHGFFGAGDGIDALAILPRPLPFRISDADGDGHDDDQDCAPNDPTAFGVPTTIQDLNVLSTNPTTMTWTNQNIGSGTRYQIATGQIPSSGSINFPAGTCLPSVASSPATDSQPNPPIRTAWYYLVKSANACSAGSWGSALRDTHPACP